MTARTTRSKVRAPIGRPPARVVVALDGASASDGALRIAVALRDRGAVLRILTVNEPLAPYATAIGGMTVAPPIDATEAARAENLRRAVATQMTRVLGSAMPVELISDWAPDGIARHAEEWDADLIVMGIGRHRPVDRLLGSETAVRVARLATVPVLAVPADVSALPRVAVAGVDFSASSVRAVEIALAVVGDAAELHLTHVGPAFAEYPHGESPDWMSFYSAGVEQRMSSFAKELRLKHPKARIGTAELRGSPAEQLLEHAERVGAQLVVTGAQHHGTSERVLFGTVSAQLLRGARCSVLVTPVVDAPAVTVPGGIATPRRGARGGRASGAPRGRNTVRR